MRVFIYALLIGLLMVIGLLPAAAQDEGETANEDWSIYLVNPNTYGLLRVDADGTTTEYDLGLQASRPVTPSAISVTADGKVGFCVLTPNQGSSLSRATVIVVDLEQNVTIYTQDLGDVTNCVAGGLGVVDDTLVMAVSTLNYPPSSPSADADTSLPAWNLGVLNLEESEFAGVLNADDSRAAQFAPQEGVRPPGATFPVPVDVSEDGVTFQVSFGVGLDAPVTVETYLWNPTADTVEQVSGSPFANGDFLEETGETVLPAYTNDVPSVRLAGPGPTYNIVELVDAEGNRERIYENGEAVIESARFVNDGEQIAVQLVTPIAGANPRVMQAENSVILLDREGNVTPVGTYDSFLRVNAVPGGFIILHAEDREGAPPIFHLDYHSADGSVSRVWDFTPDGQTGVFWTLVGVVW